MTKSTSSTLKSMDRETIAAMVNAATGKRVSSCDADAGGVFGELEAMLGTAERESRALWDKMDARENELRQMKASLTRRYSKPLVLPTTKPRRARHHQVLSECDGANYASSDQKVSTTDEDQASLEKENMDKQSKQSKQRPPHPKKPTQQARELDDNCLPSPPTTNKGKLSSAKTQAAATKVTTPTPMKTESQSTHQNKESTEKDAKGEDGLVPPAPPRPDFSKFITAKRESS